MKLSGRKIFLIAFITPLLVVGGYFLHQALQPPNEAERRFNEAIAAIDQREESKPVNERLSEELRREEAIKTASEQWYQDLLVRYPWMQITYRDVPDEQNGYLQLIEFGEKFGQDNGYGHPELPIPDEISSMFYDKTKYDPKRLSEWLGVNRGLIDEILRVAELPDRSIKSIPPDDISPIPAAVISQAADMLILESQLLFENGEMEKALRRYRAAINICDHLDKIESPFLLGRTISIVIKVNTYSNFQENILPFIIHNHELLHKWRKSLKHHLNQSSDIPSLLRGEWHIATSTLLLPYLLSDDQLHDGGYTTYSIPDDQEALDSIAHLYRDVIALAEKIPTGTYSTSTITSRSPNPELSVQGKEIHEMMAYSVGWFRGHDRAVSMFIMNDALLAIALGETPPVEPTTGAPFDWDPTTRTLSAPIGAPDGIEDLILPK